MNLKIEKQRQLQSRKTSQITDHLSSSSAPEESSKVPGTIGLCSRPPRRGTVLVLLWCFVLKTMVLATTANLG